MSSKGSIVSFLFVAIFCNTYYNLTFAQQPVKVGNKYGYIDSTGIMIIEPRYESASRFTNGFATVSYNNHPGIINSTGKLIYSSPDSNTWWSQTGKLVISEGLIAFSNHHRKFGFIDTNGSVVINPSFDIVSGFHNGLALVCEDRDVHPDTGSGCGTPVSHCRYGYINRSGMYRIKPEYSEATDFYHGYAIAEGAYNESREWIPGIIDTTGKSIKLTNIHEDSFQCYYFAEANGIFFNSYEEKNVTENELLNGFIAYTNLHRDRAKNLVFPPAMDFAVKFSEGIARMHYKLGNRDGFRFMTLYDTLLSPAVYYSCMPFHEGAAAVLIESKWGFIDKTGKYIIEPKFDFVVSTFNGLSFNDGIARVVYNYKVCYINKQGTIIWTSPEEDFAH